MTSSATLVLEFEGRCMIRQPTDPDPYDERRGVSGYTFAFGDEPDLNRVIYFQENPAFPVRSHCPPVGVKISRAVLVAETGNKDLPALVGAAVNLLDDPVLENRNWTLTPPGYEPIVPFHISIAKDGGFLLQRLDVLDPSQPNADITQLSQAAIEAKGATGLSFEPATVFPATGIFNYYYEAVRRRDLLKADLEAMKKIDPNGQDPRSVVIAGRIFELQTGIDAYEANQPDRRTAVQPLLERFGFNITGNAGLLQDPKGFLPFPPDLSATSLWRIDFWIGGWDFDALCGFTQGQLQIPLILPPDVQGGRH